MQEKIYFAKSPAQGKPAPTVGEHLCHVAQQAAHYGTETGMAAEARLAGQCHDFGKYSEAFQKVLRRELNHVDHAVCGAAYLYATSKMTKKKWAVIEAINGYHDGLRSFGDIENGLNQLWNSTQRITTNNGKTPALKGQADYASAEKCFRRDFPDFSASLKKGGLPAGREELESMLYTRMLLSCLVDADYSVSAWEHDGDETHCADARMLDIAQGLEKLYAYRAQLQQSSTADPDLNRLRGEIFDRCGKCGAEAPEGLFTLTAPTGTGKTLALLHFALRHAQATGKRRIIIVLPFLTLIEQSADTYRKILPEVLEDHSQNQLPDALREFAEKWNSPFIITTSVNFFESLFSDRPSDCRKLHNLAHSVVVFDEAQSLPPKLLGATLGTVNELCARYHMTMVFSTATQPDFASLPKMSWCPTEILPEHPVLYRQLQRTTTEWRLNGLIPLTEIAGEMQEHDRVCGIFNLRRHARNVFNLLQEANSEAAFLLSTDLCPAHRSRILQEIRQRMDNHLPCRVASTQCIEAGVDLDFRRMYRALAPMESIIQAAGRCNRNGCPEKGIVTVFEPEDERRIYPDDFYQNAAVVVKNMVMDSMMTDIPLDLNDPENIRRYYKRLFADVKDKDKLTQAIEARDFAEVKKQYRLIEGGGAQIIVPYEAMRGEYEALRSELLNNGITPVLMKQAAPLTVTVYVGSTEKLKQFAVPVFHRPCHGEPAMPSGYWLLQKGYEDCYSERGGLQFPEETTAMIF